MIKRSLRQQQVVSYALLRGKLVPRDEVLKQRLGLDNPKSDLKDDEPKKGEQQAVNFAEMSAKELKAILDKKGIEYKGNVSKEALIELLNAQEHSDFELNGGE